MIVARKQVCTKCGAAYSVGCLDYSIEKFGVRLCKKCSGQKIEEPEKELSNDAWLSWINAQLKD